MMNRNRRELPIATVVLAAMMAVPVGFAQSSTDNNSGASSGQSTAGPHFGRHFGRFGWTGRAFRQLGLTDAQKTQLRQIRQNHRANMDGIHQQLRASMQEMLQAYGEGTFDEALASQKLAEVAPLKAKLMAERFKMRQEMLALLTPEQKTQLDQMRNQFKARRAGQGGGNS